MSLEFASEAQKGSSRAYVQWKKIPKSWSSTAEGTVTVSSQSWPFCLKEEQISRPKPFPSRAMPLDEIAEVGRWSSNDQLVIITSKAAVGALLISNRIVLCCQFHLFNYSISSNFLLLVWDIEDDGWSSCGLHSRRLPFSSNMALKLGVE